MTTSPTFEQVLNRRVVYLPSGTDALTGVVVGGAPRQSKYVLLLADDTKRTYTVPLNQLTRVEDLKPPLEDDLRSMVVRIEATAQLCGDGAGGLARAAAEAQAAAQLRALLERHGHDCAPCKVYSSSKEALAALTKASG